MAARDRRRLAACRTGPGTLDGDAAHGCSPLPEPYQAYADTTIWCGCNGGGRRHSWLTRSARGQSRINAVDDISRMTLIPVIGQLSLDPARVAWSG